jgi:putative membrane protein insertion efficiency factor
MKRWIAVFVSLFLIVVVHDLVVTPERAFGARTAMRSIDAYQELISPRIRPFAQCRFVPSCSAYTREKIRKQGLAVGSIRGVIRIARCGPWTPKGTVDPP